MNEVLNYEECHNMHFNFIDTNVWYKLFGVEKQKECCGTIAVGEI